MNKNGLFGVGRLLSTVGAIALVFCTQAGLSKDAAKPGVQVRSTKLALNWKPEPQFGGFYAADLGGHFTRHGLKVEILPGGAGTPVVQMVAAGQVDFGIASADEVVISRARGSDVVAIFATYQTNPQGIMTHEEKGYKSLKDVFMADDATVALQKGLPYVSYLKNKFGAPKASLVPYQGGITAFIADKNMSQQCFVTSEPLEARRRGIKEKTFLIAESGYNPYTTVVITRAEVLKADPVKVKDLVAAVRSGWEDYLRDPTSVNSKMEQLNPSMDAQTFRESADAQKSLIQNESGTTTSGKATQITKLGIMTDGRWRGLVDQLFEMKIISTKPNFKTLYSNQ